MTTHILPGGHTALVVEVPELSIAHRVRKYCSAIRYYSDGSYHFKNIPRGDWQLVGPGTCDQVSEEDAVRLVEEVRPLGRIRRYKDYEFPKSHFYNAEDSLWSLLRSWGYRELNKIVLLIKQ